MATLRRQAVFGVKWIATSNITVTVLRFVRLAILANILIPDDFGLMGMVIVVLGFGQAFSDMGISLALIWKQDIDKDQFSSVYWFNISTGILVSVIVAAAAPLIVRFYNEPRLENLLLWIAPIFLIISVGQPFQMMIQKELHFNILAKIEISGAVVGTATAITTAILGAGVYALIWGQLADATMRALLFTIKGCQDWRPGIHFKVRDLKGFIRFGLFQMGERILNYYYTHIDYLIIGRYLGSEILGIYMLAYQLVIEPFHIISPAFTRVAFPIFAKRQDDNNKLCQGYYELSKVIALIIFPVLALMAATAPLFVPVIFGEKWTAAITIIQILIVLGALRALINPFPSPILAKGRADITFYWNLIGSIINTLVFLYIVRYGLYALAWSENVLTFIYLLLALLFLRYVIGLKFTTYFLSIAKPLLANTAIGGVVYLLYLSMRNTVANEIILLIIVGVFGLSLAFLYVWFFERSLLKEYWGLLVKKEAKLSRE